MDAIYYENQSGWTKSEYCYLHRYLHRMFYYHQKYENDIKKLDLDRMTDETKVIIFCIIQYYHLDYMFSQYENLKPLEKTRPLKKQLILDDSTKVENDIYSQMNIIY